MSGTYHIWPITIALLFVYVISLAGLRLGLYTTRSYRRFWNVLLLIVFLVAALLGLFFVLKINYKIEVKDEDLWMLLHVDAGIALAVIAIFHTTWHISYYVDMFRKKRKRSGKNEGKEVMQPRETIPDPPLSRVPVYILGFTTMVGQVVVLRAFLNVFDGNELVVGVILGNWMLLTGLGAWLGRRVPRLPRQRKTVANILFWLGILPVLTITLLYLLRNMVFIHGTMVGLFSIFLFSLMLLFPFCVLSGYMFSLLSYLLSGQSEKNITGQVYGWEAIGGVAGGLLFSVVLVYLLTSLQILALVFLVNMTGALLWLKARNTGWKIPVLFGTGALLTLTLFVFPADRYLQHFQYPNQKIRSLHETPYGNLVVTENGDQVNLFENGVPVASTLDLITREEDVHYAMVQRDHPNQILLISGGITGMIGEIVKYPVEAIDYLEINPWLFRVGHLVNREMDQPKVNMIRGDVRHYLRKSNKNYDMVLMHIPPPTTALNNRFYTVNFYRQLARHLNAGGVICFGLPTSPNYQGKENAAVLSLMVQTLKKVWDYVEIVPGEKNYFLASDEPLSLEIARLITQRGVETQYVSPYYLDDDLLKERNDQIMQQITPVKKINSDLNPVGYYRQLAVWLSYYRLNYKVLGMIMSLLFLFFLVKTRHISMAIFTGGVAASVAEILLLFIFQILFGHLYLMISFFLTSFMSGLALGALRGNRAGKNNYNIILSYLFLMALLLFISPLYLVFSSFLLTMGMFTRLLIFFHMFLFAFVTGRLFNTGSIVQAGPVEKVVSTLYSSDLYGGALGALAVAGFLLPLLGVTGAAMVTGLFCLVVVLILLIWKKS